MKAYQANIKDGNNESSKTSVQGKGRFKKSSKIRSRKKQALRRLYKKSQRNKLKQELKNEIEKFYLD